MSAEACLDAPADAPALATPDKAGDEADALRLKVFQRISRYRGIRGTSCATHPQDNWPRRTRAMDHDRSVPTDADFGIGADARFTQDLLVGRHRGGWPCKLGHGALEEDRSQEAPSDPRMRWRWEPVKPPYRSPADSSADPAERFLSAHRESHRGEGRHDPTGKATPQGPAINRR